MAVEGTVEVRVSTGVAWRAAAEGLELRSGDTIRTGENGRATVVVGGEHVVELQSRSVFALSSLDVEKTWFGLNVGTVLLKLRKLTGGRSLRVKAPGAVAAVRGTEFGVSAQEDSSRIGVFQEGQVEVEAESGGPPVDLLPNRETEVRDGQTPVSPHALRYFAFYKARMDLLRLRQRFFMDRWRQKYRLPR